MKANVFTLCLFSIFVLLSTLSTHAEPTAPGPFADQIPAVPPQPSDTISEPNSGSESRAPELIQDLPLPTDLQFQPASLARPNVVAIELGGQGGIYSLLYDRSLGQHFSLGAGVSYLHLGFHVVSGSVLTIPISTRLYFSPDRHRAFISGGVTLVDASSSADLSIGPTGTKNGISTGFIPIPVVGFGYEFRGSGGVLFRLTPYLAYTGVVVPWLGTTLGANF